MYINNCYKVDRLQALHDNGERTIRIGHVEVILKRANLEFYQNA